MKVSYWRELDRNFLVIRQEEFEDQYQVGMIVKNKIPGFLECSLSFVDRSADFCYEITSRQSLRLLLERRRISGTELSGLLEELLCAVQSLGEYLLDSGGILLDPDYIYLDPDGGKTCFCCFPFGEADTGKALLELAEYFLERLDRQDPEAVSLGYEFYRMAGEEHFSLEQLLLKWREEREQKDFSQDAEEKEEPEREREQERKAPLAAEGPECATATVFLKQTSGGGLVLRSENPAFADMRMTGESFLIGKKKDAVDGWLKARGISRIHGKLSREEGEFYLTDLNSTNGTFLNGGRLGVNEKARIRQGDQVGFADVKYVVDLSGELLYNGSSAKNVC